MNLLLDKNPELDSRDELFMIEYSKSDYILDSIRDAERQELHLINGVLLNDDIITLYAHIDDETGLWNIKIEVDHGSVSYKAHDREGQIISLTTVPKEDFIKNIEKKSREEINEIIALNSSHVLIDLRDHAGLQQIKKELASDYVLKHIPLANPGNDSAARLVIWHLRAYRKIFKNYEKEYSFLWAGTSFQNARSLAAAMRAKGYLK